MGNLKEGDNTAAAMRALADDAAQQLEGTCKSIVDLGEEYEDAFDSSPTFTARLDELVFECTACNWWCSQDECNEDESGQWVCDDCKADKNG